MFIKNYAKFLKYFGEGRKLKLVFFTLLSMIAGIMEFIGISLIYPFIVLIVKPETIVNRLIYIKFQAFTNIQDVTVNALLLGLVIMLVFVIKNIFMIFFNFLQCKFTSCWRMDIVNKFMEYFLFGSYKDNLKISQADKDYILKTLCSEALNVCALKIISLGVNSIIVSMIVLLIFYKYPIAGIAAVVFVFLGMKAQNHLFKNKLLQFKDKISEENKLLNRDICTNIENHKEIKIMSTEKFFYERFCKQASRTNDLQVMIKFLDCIPPHLIEIFIVFSLIILGAVVGLENIHNQANIVASFALLVAAIFRIAPLMNRIQSAILSITTGETFVQSLLEYYEQLGMDRFEYIQTDDISKINFENKIELKNITFGYDEGRNVLNGISFEINKGDFIGIIGHSGVGKSTLIDILTGLLPIKDGEILVDGILLNSKNFAGFRKLIGYVPQDVRLLDASVKENVAWGELAENIDENRIVEVLKEASLYDFISSDEAGIELNLAQRGLSAGQKQRLAIARALYSNPDILILDEATSALDVNMEAEITEMLNRISQDKTIISVAHRLSTLKMCNKLIYMKNGEITDIGSFEYLSAKHEDFNNLIKLYSLK